MLKYLPGYLACSAAPPSISTWPSVMLANTDLVTILSSSCIICSSRWSARSDSVISLVILLALRLEVPSDPSFHDCGSAHRPVCRKVTPNRAPCDIESQSVFLFKNGHNGCNKKRRERVQGRQCPTSKSATCRWSMTRRPARSPASTRPASTSSSRNSSASSAHRAAANPRCSTSSPASSRRPAARSGSPARR